MLALDPQGDPTVGACIAGDLAGPRSHRYGRMRDLVLGVTVVLGDGLVSSSGGKVVKNVAGYDLGKLFCGSRGTLGVICRASLRLHPRPETAATFVSAGDGPAKARVIQRATLVPSALDATSERLALLFEGGTRAVEAQLASTRELIGGEQAGDEIWDEVHTRQRPAGTRSPGCLAGSGPRCNSIPRAYLRDRPPAHRRLHALRLLPADVSDVRATRADGGGLAPRADLAHGWACRRDDDRQRPPSSSTSTAASAAWRASRPARREFATTC